MAQIAAHIGAHSHYACESMQWPPKTSSWGHKEVFKPQSAVDMASRKRKNHRHCRQNDRFLWPQINISANMARILVKQGMEFNV
jgi:hypothetical protein